MNDWLSSTSLNASNAAYMEGLYEAFLSNPESVPEHWRTVFSQLPESGAGSSQGPSHREVQDRLRNQARKRRSATPRGATIGEAEAVADVVPDTDERQSAVLRLIHSYRLLGHLRAVTDPIQLRGLPPVPDIDPYYQGLTDADLDHTFSCGTLEGPSHATLRDILNRLHRTYSSSIGIEYMHIADLDQKRWLQCRLEQDQSSPSLTSEQKQHLLEMLTAAEGMERYLHTKYVGQKRFSLEGGESFISMMDELVQYAGSKGVEEMVFGMAHRGRLNMLVNVMGKVPGDLFEDFEGKVDEDALEQWTGDVKYHEGFSSDVVTPGGKVHVALSFNPSHLEIINPVVEGSVRARQDRRGDFEREEVLPVLVHGDAAIAGQGVVYETFNLAQTRGFATGGTIHVVINNRIGFTLSDPLDARSTLYCTDIGKVVQAPIFHVNGDDPEAVLYCIQMALDFRLTFKKDVVIDLVCYRRHGHNEADEPSATQPMMYKKIADRATVRQVYADRLIQEQVITADQATQMVEDYRDELDRGHVVAKNVRPVSDSTHRADWSPYLNKHWMEFADTSLKITELKRLGELMTRVPDDVPLHPRVDKIMADRRKMVAGALPIDWGCAETLAYASLLDAGYPVRLTGQDSGRGTFFHRHVVLHSQRNGDNYVPLRHLSENQPWFTIVDSILSEEAVVGFEYGYSTTDPETLVVWEAQFGDFVNVAQVVIDQFISSSEQKWRRQCGLVMLLPHGWEGQGPEHSSARLERFMQLCAQDNMQVCIPINPSQMFHMLRRQMIRPVRKPLIVMSPKSMLRRKLSFSTLEELAYGKFMPLIGEAEEYSADRVQRVVMCQGKVYYDLVEARAKKGLEDRIAIICVQQMYPFPIERLTLQMHKYSRVREVVWAQEEPMNQGCWYSSQHHIRACLLPHQSLSYAGRPLLAAPAGGYYKKHHERQTRLVDAALNLEWTDPHPIVVTPARDEPAFESTRS